MKIVAKTDVGLVRKQNQDSYNTGELANGAAWAVVCDGMGGAAGGAVASSVAVKMISEKITGCYREGLGENTVKNIVVSAIESANACLFDMSESSDELYGMGTTAVAVIADVDIAYIAHVGDSRAYIIRNNGEIAQLTRDHSVVAQMIERGEITPDEAKSHPDRHIITRAVGVNDKINVDFLSVEVTSGDILVVCTDGLSGFVTEEDMLSLTADGQYHKFADRLVNLANKNGGADNITVVAFVK